MSIRLLSKGSNPDNFLKLPSSVCDCGDVATCTDSGTDTVTLTDSYDGVTVDNVFYATTTAGLTANDAAAVQAEIKTAIEAAGYYEVNNVSYTYAAGDFTFSQTGEARVNSITFADTAYPLTALCTPSYECEYSIVYPGGTDSVLDVNGVETTFANPLVYGVNTVQDVEAELLVALPNGNFTVTDTGSAWLIVITLTKGSSVTLDGRIGLECNCVVVYVA